ncbi:hypothetical protein SAMN04487906_0071 [Zhouia amylolytica]|uniref:Tetratricopeptide repeat-containing protein n=1 Tax=Zhouia amylolytica TaxID=376730 RepID=A0A1I6P254_9FLAO|nr:DUF6340 family protein [Zhouia amylolytica]MCQ0111709.1 tetratricopeptide repeat protein [Zhouia amylolytica]SFS34140.1 hypothetical protein SAMN04487906_0071 [Zhouia amylolytica]
MKKLYFLYLMLCALGLEACSSGYVYLNYPQEPEVILPKGVENIVVVNRSLTREDDQQNKTLESVATGEIAGSDKLASDEAVKGVMSGVQHHSNLTVLIPDTLRLYGTGTRRTPDVLKWEKVDAICKASDADVLLVLETFDSNSDILLNTVADQVSSVINTGKVKGRLPQQTRVDVRSYWRLYDPYSKTIIDQFQQTHYMNFNLVNGVPPLNALPETAYAAGFDYISRFLPSYYRVRRDMYKKGKGRDKRKFDAGWRRSEVANWDGAIEIWTGIAANPNSKSAGRAALNVAVAYEVLGKTDLALEWAQRAYEDYGDKQGRDYAKILLRRKRFEL